MSNLLNTNFDIFRGWPDGSALEFGFEPDTGQTITEGKLVYVASRELPSAKVLRIKDSTLVTAPTLLVANRGQAYVVAGVGGLWSTYAIGDIVEWSGTAWHVIVSHATGGWVPHNTRVVVIETGAAGLFTGHEKKVMTYNWDTTIVLLVGITYTSCVASDIGKIVVGAASGHTGTLISYDNATRIWHVKPTTVADTFLGDTTFTITAGTGAGTTVSITPSNSWVATTVPVTGNRIQIVGVLSVYEGQYFDYSGTVWFKAARQIQAPALIKLLSSGAKASTTRPHAWIVIQGNDQFDGQFTNNITCLKCSSGAVIKLPSLIANTLVPGDKVCATAGVFAKLTVGAGLEWPQAQVLYSNATAGVTGYIIVATY